MDPLARWLAQGSGKEQGSHVQQVVEKAGSVYLKDELGFLYRWRVWYS